MLEGLEPQKNKAVYCKVEQTLATLSEDDQRILIEAIDDRQKWGARTLSNSLRQRGVSIADTTITKHRVRACACYRD